jgi:serine/threonine-protein phosphatase 6 regulatory ankyrin repeat subunit B
MMQVQQGLRPNSHAGLAELVEAACSGHGNMVLALLDAGADVNKATTGTDVTPLFMAAFNGHQSVVDSLLAVDGIEVNKARTDDGTTPLFIASELGHQSVVDSLLAADGIDINKANDYGETPIWAVSLIQSSVIYNCCILSDAMQPFVV